MEVSVSKNGIRLDGKVRNFLDEFVISFTKLLDVRYVIISGYIAILFGRTRATEDVDIFIDSLTKEKFTVLYEIWKKWGYEVIDADNLDDAFEKLSEHLAIRVAKAGTNVPNFEIKIPKPDNILAKASLENRIAVHMDNDIFYTSPIEQQIAYKIYLGSEKDYLDARQLFKVFNKDIDYSKLERYISFLTVDMSIAKKILGINGWPK